MLWGSILGHGILGEVLLRGVKSHHIQLFKLATDLAAKGKEGLRCGVAQAQHLVSPPALGPTALFQLPPIISAFDWQPSAVGVVLSTTLNPDP